VVAPPLLHQGLLLALLSCSLRDFALLRIALGLFLAPCLLFPARLLLALGALLAQGLGVAVRGAARLLHELRMRFAALLLLAFGDHLPLGLLGALGHQLFALGLLLAAGLLACLFDALGLLLALELFRAPALFAARGLGELGHLVAAPFRLGLFRPMRLRGGHGLTLAPRLFLATDLVGPRSFHAALLLLLGSLLCRDALGIDARRRRLCRCLHCWRRRGRLHGFGRHLRLRRRLRLRSRHFHLR